MRPDIFVWGRKSPALLWLHLCITPSSLLSIHLCSYGWVGLDCLPSAHSRIQNDDFHSSRFGSRVTSRIFSWSLLMVNTGYSILLGFLSDLDCSQRFSPHNYKTPLKSVSRSSCPCCPAVFDTEYTQQATSSEHVLNLCANEGSPAREGLALAPLLVLPPVSSQAKWAEEIPSRHRTRVRPNHRDQRRNQQLYSSASRGPFIPAMVPHLL